MSVTRQVARSRRRARVRRSVQGTDERPRLCVFRSDKHVYVQVITDVSAQTLVAVSTLTPELRGQLTKTTTVEAAKQVGLLAARRCQERGIASVVFDRNGFQYHGRVRAVAEGAREGGLQF
jgi:large subunit ribosomal protein L18